MDERTTQIREGAGLEESRINTEFIELLRKYSSPFLLVLALIVAAYAGNNFLSQRRNAGVNEAFRQHAEITETASPSPQSLSALAAQHGDVRAVGLLARLREADLWLEAVRTGMKPGAAFVVDPQTQQTTGEVDAADLLTEADRASALDKAQRLYESVVADASGDRGTRLHAISGCFGLAAVAESRGDADAARSAYTRAAELAGEAGFPMYAALATERMGTIETALVPTRLYADDELPPDPVAGPPAEPAGEPANSPAPTDPALTDPAPVEAAPAEPTDEVAPAGGGG
jgi:hypothetical protein